eukprot:COSAG03_NODE_19461_length_336_cov_0.746835_1_plen_63_part_10
MTTTRDPRSFGATLHMPPAQVGQQARYLQRDCLGAAHTHLLALTWQRCHGIVLELSAFSRPWS